MKRSIPNDQGIFTQRRKDQRKDHPTFSGLFHVIPNPAKRVRDLNYE